MWLLRTFESSLVKCHKIYPLSLKFQICIFISSQQDCIRRLSGFLYCMYNDILRRYSIFIEFLFLVWTLRRRWNLTLITFIAAKWDVHCLVDTAVLCIFVPSIEVLFLTNFTFVQFLQYQDSLSRLPGSLSGLSLAFALCTDDWV